MKKFFATAVLSLIAGSNTWAWIDDVSKEEWERRFSVSEAKAKAQAEEEIRRQEERAQAWALQRAQNLAYQAALKEQERLEAQQKEAQKSSSSSSSTSSAGSSSTSTFSTSSTSSADLSSTSASSNSYKTSVVSPAAPPSSMTMSLPLPKKPTASGNLSQAKDDISLQNEDWPSLSKDNQRAKARNDAKERRKIKRNLK